MLFQISAWHVAAVAALFAVLLVVLFLFPGYSELIFGLAFAAVGAGKLVAAHLEGDENDELPPASRKFRELADPSRPLAANDPLSAGPQPPAPIDAKSRSGS